MKMKMRKTVTMALALTLLISVMTTLMPVTATAEAGDTGITLGTGKIAKGNKVYFGNQILWRVLKSGDGKALLISENTLAETTFNPSESDGNAWSGSTAQTWCKDYYTNWPAGIEKNAILATSVSETNDQTENGTAYYYKGNYLYSAASLDNEHFFFLSAKEADTLFSNDNDRKATGSSAWWWLRSPYASGSAGVVDNDGWVRVGYVFYSNGARPAFNLNLSSVLFTSEISSETSTSYELTMKDENLAISKTAGKNATRKGNVVTVPYDISGSSVVGSTSAYVMVTDKAYTESETTVLQYAALTDGTESGTGTFALDSGITGTWGTDYHVYLLAVNESGEKKTDYVSAPTEILHVHDFTYSAGTGDQANTITAVCGNGGCDITSGLTMTISAPADLTYDRTPKAAALNTDYNTTAFPGTYTISYEGTGSTTYNNTDAPTNAGDYKATVAVETATAEVSFTINKAEPSVIAPAAKTLTYTGSAQELVNTGSTNDGTLYYAVTTENAAPADNLYTTSIPAKTDAGIYYIWYKVIGDANHTNTDPDSVTVTISPADKAALNAAIDSAAKYGDSIKDYTEIAATLNAAIEAARAVAANDNATPDAIADAVTKLNAATEAAKAAVEAAKNQAAAQAVIDAIKTLPENVTLNDKAAVEAARKAYDALTEAQKALVSADVLKKLTDAEAAIAAAEKATADADAAQKATDAIKALPENVTLNDKAAVEAARKAYDALTDAQKALVPADVLKKLTDAEAAIAAAEKDLAAAQKVTEAIMALPEPATLNDKAAVEAARKAYDALTDAQKALVPVETVKKLTDAEAAIAAAERISLRKCTITAQNRIYTGKAITPRVTVMYGDTKLKEGQDYTLSYKKVKQFQKVRVVVKGKGRFKGTRNAYFKIVPKGTAITKVSGGKKQFTVKWKKQKDITGFQIEYSLRKDFAKSRRTYIRSDKTLSATIGKLKAGRTYYVRVRTYHKRNRRLFFSTWTEAVAVNTNGAKANEARVINIAVNVGDELDLNALATGVTTWESSDEGVATVSAEGLAKALAAGEATFTGFDANGEAIKIVMQVSDSATLELEAIDLTDFGGGIVEDIDADEPFTTEEELELTLE